MESDVALDFYCGLGGWTDGLLAEGFHCIGFDVERHDYGTGGYPGQLILQDVLTVTGAQFRSIADRIRVLVASPPCTEYSYMAMPWKRAKQIRRALLGEGDFPDGYKGSRTLEQLNALFAACFRIQRELSAVAGRHIPLIVENVKGAQPWVGMAKANFGSYYLWGDVGRVGSRVVPLNGALRDAGVRPRSQNQKVPGFRFDGSGKSFQTASTQKCNPDGTAHPPGSWFAVADSKTRGAKSNGQNWSLYAETGKNEFARMAWSNSEKRKQASAMIAKIPFPLAQHVARCYKSPCRTQAAGVEP